MARHPASETNFIRNPSRRRRSPTGSISRRQLSRIENGPPVTDLAKLIAWVCALGIPEELLWFKLPKDKPDAREKSTGGITANGGTTVPPALADSDCEKDDMRRRVLLQSLLVGTGTALSAAMLGNLAQIEQVRRELDKLLDGSEVGETTIEHWEAAASEHTQGWLEVAPGQRLSNIAGDFVELQHLLERQQTTKHRVALTRASSELAVLAGHCLHAMGEHRNAQAWFRTAGLAAREAQDRQLAGAALVSSAMDGLFHDVPERTLAKLAKAQELLGQQASPGRVRALIVQARVLATLNRGHEAQRCIVEAEAVFPDMPASALANAADGHTERLFYFTVGNAYTRLGMTKEANAMQREALHLYRANEYCDVALTRLDQARCMIRQGDVTSACEYAAQTITAVPAEHQGLVRHEPRGDHGHMVAVEDPPTASSP